MRKLVYYVAISADGFICHEDGAIDGFMNQHGGALQQGPHIDDFLASYMDFDTVLMGRKTYDLGVKFGVTNPYPMLKQYLFSRSMTESPDENVELVREKAVDLIRNLKTEAGKPIWLCGGAEMATTLFQENLIDELVLKLNPFLMGKGIPLFSGVVEQTDLRLEKSKVYSNGCVWLYYHIVPQN